MSYWRNRVASFSMEVPEDLLANPANARRHPARQRETLTASLDEIGWIAPVIVNDTTGFVIDGHARIEEAISNGEAVIPVVHVDLTPDEERLALATFDPITGLAVFDQERLDDLIASIETDSSPLNDLLASLSGEDVDGKPIRGSKPKPNTSIVLVYNEDEYTEIVGALSLLPGSTPGDKVLRLVRSTLV
jgi:ParB/Sulfiredoxin domain